MSSLTHISQLHKEILQSYNSKINSQVQSTLKILCINTATEEQCENQTSFNAILNQENKSKINFKKHYQILKPTYKEKHRVIKFILNFSFYTKY